MKIAFVDDRENEISNMINSLDYDSHSMLFINHETPELSSKKCLNVDIVFVGYGLSNVGGIGNGDDVAKELVKNGFQGKIYGNSGGGQSIFQNQDLFSGFVDRKVSKIKAVLI